VGRLLAQRTGLPFYDADDFHPEANVRKMKKGVPLTDADRAPWLAQLARLLMRAATGGGAVLACSALRDSYRRVLAGKDPGAVRFIHLKGDRRLILERMKKRAGHFMPPALLDSQFETLEEPAGALTVTIDRPPEEIVDEILRSGRG